MKRYRDADGRLTVSLEELKQLTRAEASDYYRPSKLYRYAADGEYYIYLSQIAPGPIVEFESFNGKQLFIPRDSLGTFLPDVAADGEELTLV